MPKIHLSIASLLLLLMSTTAWPQEQSEASEVEGTSAVAENEPGSTQLFRAIEGVENALRSLARDDNAERIERAEEVAARNLAAQEEVASWAKEIAVATVAAALLTLAGLLLIWRTLHHTRRAADYTKSMLEEAKRTTSAMNRAWIKVDIGIQNSVGKVADRDFVPENCDILVKVENIGGSPALEVHTSVFTTDEVTNTHEVVAEFSQQALRQHQDLGKRVGVSVFPGSHYYRPWYAHFEPEMGESRFIVAVVCYKTLYDEHLRQTAFVCGVGWNGMTDYPDDVETSTFNWAGGFAT